MTTRLVQGPANPVWLVDELGEAIPSPLPIGETAVQFIDENGVAYGVKHSENRPIIVTVSHGEAIAEGNLPGHTALRLFGHNTSVAAALETVYHGSNLKTYLAAAERLQVTSTDADDTGAGNGARTLTITGLDTNYDVLVETVTMNGVANVLTDASFLRLTSLIVATAGVTGYNEGSITVSNNADTVVLDTIVVRENKNHSASYTVPAGYTGYITNTFATESSTKGCEFSFWVRLFGGLWTMQKAVVLLDSSIVMVHQIPMKLPQRADVEIRAEAILAGAIVTAGFDGWLEEN